MSNHSTGVLVTRPANQNENLCRAITALGCRPLPLPTLAITPLPPADLEDFAGLLARRPVPDWLIFISANAVEQSWPFIGAEPELIAGCRFAAIGAATSAALTAQGVSVSAQPLHQYDSEGLLALPEFTAPLAAHILIIRGRGGREHLATALRQRGARVDYGECYRRELPTDGASQLAQWLDEKAVDLITVTSRAALHNLFELATPSHQEALKRLPYLLMSPAIRKTAQELGITGELLIASQPSDAGLCRSIESFIR